MSFEEIELPEEQEQEQELAEDAAPTGKFEKLL